ncbi:Hypothetical predicted protein [Marmota monax]|uniref:C-type lectin domain-containing protein n=1 Tax=Marmota monax TaxID=9995 RepID=A0A5E4AZK2_MARMO|nr:Hypothetical predicted protein [Marmota monax]
MKATEMEVPDAHFTVDKQNISLWPRGKHQLLFCALGPNPPFAVLNRTLILLPEPPPKQDPSLVLRKPLILHVAIICLSLVLVASVVLQAILYPWFMGTISDIKTDAQLLKGRVNNVSALSSKVEKNSHDVEAAGMQIRMVDASLDSVNAQILTLTASIEKATAQIQSLTRNWEEVGHLNAQIPELKRDLDKASALNAKVRGLQSSLETISKSLKQQNDILQMVSQDWKYFKGNFYYFSHTPKTWYSAQQFCMSRNSHLTSVTSKSEQLCSEEKSGQVSHSLQGDAILRYQVQITSPVAEAGMQAEAAPVRGAEKAGGSRVSVGMGSAEQSY